MKLRLCKFNVERLLKDGACDVCIPITASNSTTNGYRCRRNDIAWRGLDFTRACWIDGSFSEDGTWEYLHVAFKHPEDPPSCWCGSRVRCRLEIGDKVHWQRRSPAIVVAGVRVAGIIDGKWRWRIELKRKSG